MSDLSRSLSPSLFILTAYIIACPGGSFAGWWLGVLTALKWGLARVKARRETSSNIDTYLQPDRFHLRSTSHHCVLLHTSNRSLRPFRLLPFICRRETMAIVHDEQVCRSISSERSDQQRTRVVQHKKVSSPKLSNCSDAPSVLQRSSIIEVLTGDLHRISPLNFSEWDDCNEMQKECLSRLLSPCIGAQNMLCLCTVVSTWTTLNDRRANEKEWAMWLIRQMADESSV